MFFKTKSVMDVVQEYDDAKAFIKAQFIETLTELSEKAHKTLERVAAAQADLEQLRVEEQGKVDQINATLKGV